MDKLTAEEIRAGELKTNAELAAGFDGETGFDGDGLAQDPQRAWRLAEEARRRGQWARAAKLVRIARAAAGKVAAT